MGVRPALGRDFTPEDDARGAPPAAIVSHEVWTRRFGASPGASGRTLDLKGKPVFVIGVLPAGWGVPQSKPKSSNPSRSSRFLQTRLCLTAAA